MRLGMMVRNMGPAATPSILGAVAEAADREGLDTLWVVDHVAIPPDQAEGSGGRYLDPLATLAYLAARTERIGLGTAVLVLPYRPPLPTAKWVATLQELSGGRLRLGVGVGWMSEEFSALGVDRRRRGALTDEVLELLRRCFAGDVVEEHGQSFLFRPRPAPPPLYVGGAAPHAPARALRFAAGWMPMGLVPDALRGPSAELRARAAAAGQARPEVVVLAGLPLSDPDRARERIAAYAEAGADALIHIERYADSDTARQQVTALAALRGAP